MNLQLKYFFIKAVRLLTNIIHVLPIKRNKIILSSFGGKQMSCNPYYISKSIEKLYPNKYRLLWVRDKTNVRVFKNTQSFEVNSLMYIYHMLTAGCVITNDTLPSYLNFSKQQLVINTWHGGGLFKKTFGCQSEKDWEYTEKINKLHNKDIKLYTISSRSWLTNVVQKRFQYKGEYLECGMPRNDILFKDSRPIKDKVRRIFNIPMNTGFILYAPTFRGNWKNIDKRRLMANPLNIPRVLEASKQRYNKNFVFIFRGHHLVSERIEDCIDATTYPDMQELLVAADIFITDYSSSLWDISLTKKPTFIYAPDLQEYSQNPGFESDYSQWPFPIAQTNDQLCWLIVNANDLEYANKCNDYHASYGSYESGNASDIIARYIDNKISCY